MTRGYWMIGFLLVAAAFAAPAWLYPGLPDRIPTHWNIEGKVDGYGGKWTLFLFPVLMIGMLVLFFFLPALSPKHFEVDTFRPTYLYIMDVLLGLFVYMQGVLLYTVYQNVHAGASIDPGRGLFAGMFLFFALMGNQLGKVRKNFYIGVRVPWTLASDRVWNDTHRLAAWVMFASGVVGFILVVSGVWIVIPIVLLVSAGLIPVVYSFVHYKALERAGQL
ncbi:MAG: SdpI family protein [Isosphaeraceae bacterium]